MQYSSVDVSIVATKLRRLYTRFKLKKTDLELNYSKNEERIFEIHWRCETVPR